MNRKWTREWPTAKGWYWFYGVGHKGNANPWLQAVRVRHDGAGHPVYVAGGTILWRSEGADGWWLLLAEPELPPPDLSPTVDGAGRQEAK